jgi:hypothetical protein
VYHPTRRNGHGSEIYWQEDQSKNGNAHVVVSAYGKIPDAL